MKAGRFTFRDYDQLPEGMRVELIRGMLVKEPPPITGHQWVVGAMLEALAAAVGHNHVLVGPVRVDVDEENVFHPDAVVTVEPVGPESRTRVTSVLVVEILSPSTARRDRRVKVPGYLAAGVREVWLLSVPEGTIEIHDREGVRRHGLDEPAVSRAVPGFSVTPRSVLRA